MFVVQCLLALNPADAPDASVFNGTWRQQMAAKLASSSKPKELLIKGDASTLTVRMTGPGKVATVDIVFYVGGPEVTYKGLDGDEFKLRASMEGANLVLKGTELEEGRVLTIDEVWTRRTEGNIQLLVDSRTTKNDHARATKITVYEQIRPTAP